MNQTISVDFGVVIQSISDIGMLDSVCTVRRETPVQDEIGAEVEDSPPAYDVIIEDVPCQIGVPTSAFDQRAGTEVQTGDNTREQNLRQVSLDGYYPTLEQDMTAEVDDEFWNILSVLHDSQHTRTILLVEGG